MLDLAIVIGTKAAKLTGLDTPIMVAELVSTIIEIDKITGIEFEDERKAAKVIAGCELFMMTALSAAYYAAAQVRALTRPPNIDGPETEPAAKLVAKEARAFVVQQLKVLRNAVPENDRILYPAFPEDGLWPDLQWAVKGEDGPENASN